MSENVTALASENLNASLRSLLEDVQRGHIRVPRFQRPFIWTDKQRLELLESIRDNMPIGSLLVWRTTKYELSTFPNVGHHHIPSQNSQTPITGWQFLLDGHQRVSTLLGLLLQPIDDINLETSKSEANHIDWDIQYDLDAEAFVFARKGSRGKVRPLLPLWTLFDGRLANKHMRELRKSGADIGWGESALDAWDARADQLCYRFQQYRIPVVVMVTDDLTLAAQTFQRINSLGTPMAEAHLVAALTWSTEFDLRERLSDIRMRLPQNWRALEDSIVLQICKGLAGLDMTKAGQKELVSALTNDSSLLETAEAGLLHAINVLHRNVGITHVDLLPYAFQLVCLAVELAKWEAIDFSEDGYVSWFWRTGWSEIFSSASYREVKSEQDHLKAIQPSIIDWHRPESLPHRFDFRLARARLFLLRLAQHRELLDEWGRPLDSQQLLEKFGREAFARLFPLPRNATDSLKALLQGPGNRFLLEPGSVESFKNRLLVGPDLPKSVLEAHFLEESSVLSLRQGDLETFIFSRASAMDAWDRSQWESENDRAVSGAFDLI